MDMGIDGDCGGVVVEMSQYDVRVVCSSVWAL